MSRAERVSPLDEFFASDAERALATPLASSEAGPVGSSPARAVAELLAFWVANEEYAVEIRDIQQIIKVPIITEVPRAPAAVLGIVSLRGIIVPVLDLRRVLGLDVSEHTRATRILVLRAGGDPVGLLVDRVTSVVRIDRDGIEAAPRLTQGSRELLRGVGRLGERLIIVLDVDAVLGLMESTS